MTISAHTASIKNDEDDEDEQLRSIIIIIMMISMMISMHTFLHGCMYPQSCKDMNNKKLVSISTLVNSKKDADPMFVGLFPYYNKKEK